MPELFKIIITDTEDSNEVRLMTVDGLPKLFNNMEAAADFCEDLNRVAREEKQTWRYEHSLLTPQEQAILRAKLMKDSF